jgi:transcriptional regulator with XRE-family HTH domain
MPRVCSISRYMDHEALASELIRALRGTRSQGAINRRLGRTSNVAHAWERGSRSPSASDFFKLARASKVDVPRVLSEFAGAASFVRGSFDARSTAAWLEALAHGRPHAELARSIERDRNTVARWLRGASEPKLPDLLRFVDVTTQRLLDFVASFVDPNVLPTLRATWVDLQRQRRLAYDLPWAHAVLRALELDVYRRLTVHEPGFIARLIGIGGALEQQCLDALARAGQIRKRRGKWTLTRVLAVDTRDDPEGNLRLKRHWAQVGAARLERAALPPSSQYSYNLFAISHAGLEEIRQAHLQYYERVRTIVAECEAATRLVLVNVQLLPLDA